MAITYEKGTVYQISIIDFKPNPDQPRKVIDPDALAELAASIKKHGILQPLLFRVNVESPYLIIVSGERRFLAARQIGLLILPAMRVEGSYAEIALVENLQRQDLTSIEEAEALQRLMDDQSYTQEQLGDILGKSRTNVGDSLSLMRLPQEIRDDCRGNRKIIKTRLLEISRKTQQRSMITAYEKLKEEMNKELTGQETKRVFLTPVVSFCQTLDKSREKLAKADIADWSNEDLEAATAAATALREAVDAFLNSPGDGAGVGADDGGNSEAPPSTRLS
ncbi:MAG: ParB/RepB/Spo0J family partition protein [Deltaproteobacteria bacterium]